MYLVLQRHGYFQAECRQAAMLTVLIGCDYCMNYVLYLQTVTLPTTRGARWRSWLRHCATSRKVAGSSPDCVTGIFH